jgi:hypothetical protein
MLPQPISLEGVRCLFPQLLARDDGTSEKKTGEDPIFISFDIAHGNSNQKKFCSIDACILDTRCLTSPTSQIPSHHTHPLYTQTYNFSYGSVGVKMKQKRALFHGQVQQVKWSQRMSLLNHIFQHGIEQEDVESCCGSRKFPLYPATDLPPGPVIKLSARPIILIGHAISCDFQTLSKACFDITDAARVVAIINTQKFAREMAHILLPEEKKFRIGHLGWNVSLRKLWLLLGMVPRYLHDCGNDAAWTLLALFRLAANILGENDQSGAGIEKLKGIVESELLDTKTRMQIMKGTQYPMTTTPSHHVDQAFTISHRPAKGRLAGEGSIAYVPREHELSSRQ